jgi:hypothetical protein
MTPHLLASYAATLLRLEPSALLSPQAVPALEMEKLTLGGKLIQMVYAPFDHVNRNARVVIVGMTPGRVQAANALRAAREALLAGETSEQAAAKAKVFASFSGPMRANLVRLLDCVGVHDVLRIETTAQLWSEKSDLAHFTSALRYPVFVDDENWSGQPDMIRTPQLRGWLERYTGTELLDLSKAIFVPLGPKVSAALEHLASRGLIERDRILEGLPHPSGANAERIAFFLGDKPADRCSSKTNTNALSRARADIIAKVQRLL